MTKISDAEWDRIENMIARAEVFVTENAPKKLKAKQKRAEKRRQAKAQFEEQTRPLGLLLGDALVPKENRVRDENGFVLLHCDDDFPIEILYNPDTGECSIKGLNEPVRAYYTLQGKAKVAVGKDVRLLGPLIYERYYKASTRGMLFRYRDGDAGNLALKNFMLIPHNYTRAWS